MQDIGIEDKKFGSSRGEIHRKKEGKVNENIDFEERKDLLESLESFRNVLFHAPIREKTNGLQISDYIAIYNTTDSDDYLMVCEPYSGDERTRLIYLPNDIIKDFLLPGQETDNEFWTELSRYYIDMGDKEFIKEDRTSVLNHTKPEYYLSTIKELVSKFKLIENEQELTHAVKGRTERVWKKLFNGEKQPNIEEFAEAEINIGDLSSGELDEMKKFIESDKQILDTAKDEHSEEEL